MKSMIATIVIPLCLGLSQNSQESPGGVAAEVRAYCAASPFPMPEIVVPRFPDRTFSIADFGGRGDGLAMNTAAFAAAIQACAGSGGGKVVVPPGTWLTGPIELKSNVQLSVDRGALVQFSTRREDFPVIAAPGGRGRHFMTTSPLHAFQARNIAITGKGIFDGGGDAWRYVKRYKLTPTQWEALCTSGGVVNQDSTEWWPSQEAMRGAETLRRLGPSATIEDARGVGEYLRPDMVQLQECEGILIDGPTFQNSPKFHLRPTQSRDVIIRDVTILCPWYAQNGDGLDPTSCRNVLIYNTTIDVGDDGLCLKPGAIAAGQPPGPACENIIIADCTVYHAHGGFVIGSETYGGVNNVLVRNCVFSGTDVGLRFKSYRGNGGLVKNIFIDGIQMRDIATDAILFDMYYAGNSPDIESRKDLSVRKAEPLSSRTPNFRDIHVKNVVCRGADRAVLVNGLPELKIEGVTFDSVSIVSRQGFVIADAGGMTITNCRLEQKEGPPFRFIDTRNVVISGGTYALPAGYFMSVEGGDCGGIRVRKVGREHDGEAVKLLHDAPADAVEWVR